MSELIEVDCPREEESAATIARIPVAEEFLFSVMTRDKRR
jgi:hypothetical protein